MYSIAEHKHAYLMAVNHFDEITKVRHTEGYRRLIGQRRYEVEEKVYNFVAPTLEEAEDGLRAYMIEESKKFNHIYFRPSDLLYCKAGHDVHDLSMQVHVKYGVLRVPLETGLLYPPDIKTRPDKLAADLALMGVTLEEMPHGPRGRGCTLRFNVLHGDKEIIKHKTLFGELCEDSISAYRSLLEAAEKELDGFDAAWIPGGVFNYPSLRKNSTGGFMYKATLCLYPFSTKDTIPYVELGA